MPRNNRICNKCGYQTCKKYQKIGETCPKCWVGKMIPFKKKSIQLNHVHK